MGSWRTPAPLGLGQSSLLFLCSLREKIHYIRNEGAQGVEKLSCDADLVILLR